MTSVYFLPMYAFDNSRVDSASARYRAIWPSRNMSSSSLWREGDDIYRNINQHDCLFIQKICNIQVHEYAKYAKSKGKVVILDLTDPIWFGNNYLYKMFKDLDAIILSSKALMKELYKSKVNIPMYAVEDGEDLSLYDSTKDNYEIIDNIPTLSWTGIKDTYSNLIYALDILRPLEGKINIKVIADEPMEFKFENIKFIKWNLDTVNKEIINSDIFINPRDPSNIRNKLKSNNKTNLAGALKVPAVYKWEDKDKVLNELNNLFVNINERESNAIKINLKVKGYYNIQRVALDFQNIIDFHSNKINFIRFRQYNLKNAYKLFKFGYT